MYGLGRQAFLFEIRQTDQNIMYYTVYFVAYQKCLLWDAYISLLLYLMMHHQVCRIVSEIAKEIEFNFQTSKAIYQGKDLKKLR